MYPMFSFIVVNYNGARFLGRCLTSVLNSDYPNFEVIFFDNGSIDNSIELVEKHYSSVPQFKVIRNFENLGLARASNFCAKSANGKYLLFLDNDTKVERSCASRIVEAMESDPQIGGGQCKLLQMDDKTKYYTAGTFVDSLGICHYRGVNVKDYGQYDRTCDIFGAIGAAFFVRSELFKRLGGFDPAYFTWGEDIDLSWRIWISGFRSIFLPEAIVYHKGGGTSSKIGERRRVYTTYRNWISTKIKNYELVNLIKYLPAYLLFLIAFGLVNIRKSYVQSILRAILYNITHLRDIWLKRLIVQEKRRVSDKWLVKRGVIWKLNLTGVLNHMHGVLSE